MTETIPPPECLLKPMHIPYKLLMGPGPSNCPQKVLNASSQQMLGHLDGDFLKILEEVKMGIKYAFQTANAMTFAVSGTGHCAMETAISNLLEPNDVFLVASSGIWGNRAYEIGKRIGAKCYQMNVVNDGVFSLNVLEKALNEAKPLVVFICHGDSSTGTVQSLVGINSLLRKFNCLMIVDAVASLGAVPLFMDTWGIDVLYSGSQKILNAPPGLSPISFSSNAMRKIKSRKTPVKSFYMDALLIGNYWNCDKNPIVYHHTAPVSLVYALREALSILTKETLEKCWERHKLCAEKLHKHLENLGLELFVPDKTNRLPSVTTIKVPNHIKSSNIISGMRNRFGIDIAGGLGTTTGKVWRIGLMGINCSEKNVDFILHSLYQCISASNYKSSL